MLGQPATPTTRLQISGHRFVLHRLERALLRQDVRSPQQSVRAGSRSLAVGCLLAGVAVAVCAVSAMAQPQPALHSAPIVMGRVSGALYVWVDETLHPVLNLASARLIADMAADPRPVRETDLARANRGPMLGISGAPQVLGAALPDTGITWAVCDTIDGAGATTTLVVGADRPAPGARNIDPERPVLVLDSTGAEAGARTYLLYHGWRTPIGPGDPALPARQVSALLLNVIPEAPPAEVPAGVAVDGGVLTGEATLCAQWTRLPGGSTDITLVAGAGLPLPAGQTPVALAQADGAGPALDAVYLPPGRSVYLRAGDGARYLVTDTGVRFVVDGDAARSLGLPATPVTVPWPTLAGLPAGPELNRRNALAARDVP